MSETKAEYKAGEAEQIMPCPFCGEDDDSELRILDTFAHYSVMCMTCSATGSIARTKTDAILLWNAAGNALRKAEQERYKDVLDGERKSFIACTKDLIAQRDEARTWARKLYRNQQQQYREKCPSCGGSGSIKCVSEYSTWNSDCPDCKGSGRIKW